jgi:hypothetical protein
MERMANAERTEREMRGPRPESIRASVVATKPVDGALVKKLLKFRSEESDLVRCK